ncbi:hypothetical protein GCM10009624_16110 [Gordonia sinesedis]
MGRVTAHSFDTVIELAGKTATGFRVPDDVVAALDRGRKPKVTVTIGGHTYRSTIAVYGGESMLPLSAVNREAAGVAAGDEVTVTLAPDDAPRTVDVPADLARALDDRGLRDRFDALSYSKQRERVTAVESAKRAETRERRIRGVVDALGAES